MSDFLREYLLVAMVGLAGVAFAAGGLLAGRFLRPKARQHNTTYESGAEPAEGGWTQVHIRYYLFGLLFLIFDVEIAFIVPWALQVERFGTFGLIEMGTFLGILALGLAYAWRKRVLEWPS